MITQEEILEKLQNPSKGVVVGCYRCKMVRMGYSINLFETMGVAICYDCYPTIDLVELSSIIVIDLIRYQME